MKKFCPGLTLIELLVVMAITALITSGGLAAYSSFNNSQTVRAVASDLKNNLRLAQGKASAQEKPAGCSVLDGYQVDITASSYSMVTLCNGDKAQESTRQNFPLPSGVTLSPATQIIFRILGEGATNAAIAVSGFGKSALVNVTQAGEIY